MTPKQIEEFKELVIAAIEKHLAEGGALTSRRFGSPGTGMCPITCLLQPWPFADFEEPKLCHEVLTSHLRFPVSEQEAWDFILAFDNSILDTQAPSPMANLGREVRNKYINFLKGVCLNDTRTLENI